MKLNYISSIKMFKYSVHSAKLDMCYKIHINKNLKIKKQSRDHNKSKETSGKLAIQL